MKRFLFFPVVSAMIAAAPTACTESKRSADGTRTDINSPANNTAMRANTVNPVPNPSVPTPAGENLDATRQDAGRHEVVMGGRLDGGHNPFETRREEARANLEAQRAKLEARMAELRAKYRDDKTVRNRSEVEQQMSALDNDLATVRRRLNDVGTSTEVAFDRIMQEIESTFARLNKSIDDLDRRG